MDWTRVIDDYCERTDPSYWSEPVNAATNAAFLLAASIMWFRLRGKELPLGMALVAVLAVIGVGSYLFHTYAQVWASLADVLPIVAFILLYVFVATRDFLKLGTPVSAAVTALFIPYSATVSMLFATQPFFAISAFYWPVPLLIVVYGLILVGRAPRTAEGMFIGAGILVVSLVFRSVDQIVCEAFPLGTHFVWHLLNALMLGWMIEVYRRHMLAGDEARR